MAHNERVEYEPNMSWISLNLAINLSKSPIIERFETWRLANRNGRLVVDFLPQSARNVLNPCNPVLQSCNLHYFPLLSHLRADAWSDVRSQAPTWSTR
jgi:hypothetical protein